jgi:hypothetical protein
MLPSPSPCPGSSPGSSPGPSPGPGGYGPSPSLSPSPSPSFNNGICCLAYAIVAEFPAGPCRPTVCLNNMPGMSVILDGAYFCNSPGASVQDVCKTILVNSPSSTNRWFTSGRGFVFPGQQHHSAWHRHSAGPGGAKGGRYADLRRRHPGAPRRARQVLQDHQRRRGQHAAHRRLPADCRLPATVRCHRRVPAALRFGRPTTHCRRAAARCRRCRLPPSRRRHRRVPAARHQLRRLLRKRCVGCCGRMWLSHLQGGAPLCTPGRWQRAGRYVSGSVPGCGSVDPRAPMRAPAGEYSCIADSPTVTSWDSMKLIRLDCYDDTMAVVDSDMTCDVMMAPDACIKAGHTPGATVAGLQGKSSTCYRPDANNTTKVGPTVACCSRGEGPLPHT